MGVDMFLPFAPIFVGIHVLVATAGDVPRVDIEKTCRASERTIKEVFGDTAIGNVYDACMELEKANLEQLHKAWGPILLQLKYNACSLQFLCQTIPNGSH